MSDAGESQYSPADSGAVAPRNVASLPISSSQTKRYKVRAGRGRSTVAGESSEEGANQSFFLDDEGTSLSSMAWRNLAGLYILWKEVLGIEPTIEDVHATFTLTTAPKKPGLYYLRTYTGQPHLVPQVNPNTIDKAWNDFWFVVSGDWGQTVVKDGETYVVPNPFKWAGALRDEIPTPSSVTRRMAEGSKTDLVFLQLVRDRMAKQVLEFSDSKKGSEVVGLSPDQAIDMAFHLFLQGSFFMSQFGDKLKEGLTSAGRVAKLEAQLSRLTQKVKDKDDQISKLEDQLGEVWDEVGSVKTQLRAQVERANELQASVDKLETEAGSNLLHGYHYAQYQVTRKFSDLDLHYMDFGFDREALVAKFGKEQNPADVAGSS
ncbi:hypothetical protein OWV82_011882 [Melia azedarach]|uniref:Uncharacterized protein n=1 Tax=Melia azedarach TaxID=155640 RepID=A0ACC1XZU3_MELAZ|nr:hypothetical protein OWV82_011882 [Melia azedarach]